MVPEALPRKEDEKRIQGPPKRKRKRWQRTGERRFFKRKKGRSNLADDQTDAWQAEGQWQDGQWNDQQWHDWPWYESEEAWAAKGKGKKGKKGKGKGKCGKDGGKDGKSGSKAGLPSLPIQPKAVPLLPQRSSLTTLIPLTFLSWPPKKRRHPSSLSPLLRPQWFWIWDAPERWLLEWVRRT